jgi:hypothetical protein
MPPSLDVAAVGKLKDIGAHEILSLGNHHDLNEGYSD